MKIEVGREELFTILGSVNPVFFDTDSRFKQYVGFSGGMSDDWWWKKDEVMKLEEENIYQLYLSAKKANQ